MSISSVEKAALRLYAMREMGRLGYSIHPQIREPRIVRRHIDGPYLACLNGTLHWLSPLERLMTKLALWDAWTIEQRLCPIFQRGAH